MANAWPVLPCVSLQPHSHRSEMNSSYAVADPGFPMGGGGRQLRGATFRKICMSKRKNLDRRGGAGGAPPGSATVMNIYMNHTFLFLGHKTKITNNIKNLRVVFFLASFTF